MKTTNRNKLILSALAVVLVLFSSCEVVFGQGYGRYSTGTSELPDSIARYDLDRIKYLPGATWQTENWGGEPVITSTLTKRTTVIPDVGFNASWVFEQWFTVEGDASYATAMVQYRSVLEMRHLWIEFGAGGKADTLTRTMVEKANGEWVSVGAVLTTEQILGFFRPDPTKAVGSQYASVTVNRRKTGSTTAALAIVLRCPIPVRDSLQIWSQTGDVAIAASGTQPLYGRVDWWDLPSEASLLNTYVHVIGTQRIPFRFEEYPLAIEDNGEGFLYYFGYGMSQMGYTIATNAPWTSVYPYTVDYDEDGTGAGDYDTDGTKGMEEDFHFFKDNYWPIKTRVAETATPATGNVTLKLESKGITALPTKRKGLRAAWLNDLEAVFARRPYTDPYGVFGLTFSQRNAGTAPKLFAANDTAKVFRQYNVTRGANPWVYTITQGENGVTGGGVSHDSIDTVLPVGSPAWDLTPVYWHWTGREDGKDGYYNYTVYSYAEFGQAASLYLSYDVDSTSKFSAMYSLFEPRMYRWSNRFALWQEKERRINSAIDRTWWNRSTVVIVGFRKTSTPTYVTVVDSLPLINTKYYSTGVGNTTIPAICWGEGGGVFTEYSDSAAIADNTVTSGSFWLAYAYRQDSNNRYDFRHASWTFSLLGLPSSSGTYYEDVLVDSANIYFAYNSAATPRDQKTGGDSISVHCWDFGPGLYPTAQSPHDHKALNPQPIGVRDITDFTNVPNDYVSISLLPDSIRAYMGDTLRLGTTLMNQQCRCKDAQDGAGDVWTWFAVHGYGTAKQPYLKIWRRLRVR